MALSGDIKTMPVTDLLQWIEAATQTGIVEFVREGEWKKVFFQSGRILFVSSSRENEKIGQFLIRKKRIRAGDLERCLEENERTGKKLTEILEECGLISHQELYEQVILLIKDNLFDLFLWEGGRFEFTDRKLPTKVKGPLALKTGRILFEVLTKIDEKRRNGMGKIQDQEKKSPDRKKLRGRIVFKVDNNKFPLPGSYEKTEISGFKKIAGEDDQETEGS